MASYDQFVSELHAKTGLSTQVLNAWAAAENGVNNNILGIKSGGSLMKFADQKQAADYTANFLKSSSYYSGIIASANQSVAAQALAIAQSPWHLGPSGLKAAGGTDPYYMRIFQSKGLITNASNYWTGKSTGATTSSVAASPSVTVPSIPSVQDIAGGVTGAIGDAIATPVYFIGIVLIGITLMLIGGLITLKPQMDKTAQAVSPLAVAA